MFSLTDSGRAVKCAGGCGLSIEKDELRLVSRGSGEKANRSFRHVDHHCINQRCFENVLESLDGEDVSTLEGFLDLDDEKQDLVQRVFDGLVVESSTAKEKKAKVVEKKEKKPKVASGGKLGGKEKTTKTKKVKDPNAPSHPRSAWIFFRKSELDEHAAEYTELSPTESMKAMGTKWGALSTSDKQPFQILAQNDKARYDEEMAEYKAKAPVEAPVLELGDDEVLGLAPLQPVKHVAPPKTKKKKRKQIARESSSDDEAERGTRIEDIDDVDVDDEMAPLSIERKTKTPKTANAAVGAGGGKKPKGKIEGKADDDDFFVRHVALQQQSAYYTDKVDNFPIETKLVDDE